MNDVGRHLLFKLLPGSRGQSRLFANCCTVPCWLSSSLHLRRGIVCFLLISFADALEFTASPSLVLQKKIFWMQDLYLCSPFTKEWLLTQTLLSRWPSSLFDRDECWKPTTVSVSLPTQPIVPFDIPQLIFLGLFSSLKMEADRVVLVKGNAFSKNDHLMFGQLDEMDCFVVLIFLFRRIYDREDKTCRSNILVLYGTIEWIFIVKE